MNQAWREAQIGYVKERLLARQPTMTRVSLTEDGDIQIHFSDGDPMESGEFRYASPTRDLLEELLDLMLPEEDEEDDDAALCG